MNDEQNTIPLTQRVNLIRIQTFFEKSVGNPYGMMAAGVMSFFILRNLGVSAFSLGVWLGLVFVSSTLLLLFEHRVRRNGLTLTNVDHRFRVRLILGYFSCGIFGSTAFFLPEQASDAAYALVFIINAAVAAAGYMAYSTAFSYGLMVNLLTLVPFTLVCFFRYASIGSQFHLLMGLSACLWQIVMTWKASQIARSATSEIESRERLRDEMTERAQVEMALRASEQQSQRLAATLRLMCDNVPDMIWAKDLEHRYTFANEALCEKLLNAETTQEPLGKTFDYFAQRERDQHPDDPEWHTLGQFSLDVDKHTLGRDEPTVFEEYGYVHGNLVFLDIHQARFINAQGELIGTVGCARDITERKAAEARVQHLAHHDVLTDLPNRALLTDRLHQALAHARRDIGKLAVLFLDLDKLKPVNDALGHDIGDLLLKSVTSRLREIVTRESDTVARLGGDEFVILLRRVNKDQDAELIAEKIVRSLGQPFLIKQHRIDISGSIGIAISPQHGEDVNQLLRHADMAMYAAKRSGRNGYRFFDPFEATNPGLPERP